MPQAALWTMAPEVVTFTGAQPLGLLDFREALGLPPERFPDGQHMDSATTRGAAPDMVRRGGSR